MAFYLLIDCQHIRMSSGVVCLWLVASSLYSSALYPFLSPWRIILSIDSCVCLNLFLAVLSACLGRYIGLAL
jgi:hypothetical protein